MYSTTKQDSLAQPDYRMSRHKNCTLVVTKTNQHEANARKFGASWPKHEFAKLPIAPCGLRLGGARQELQQQLLFLFDFQFCRNQSSSRGMPD
jgi:hypothetical protein